jgi:hypothetical protein
MVKICVSELNEFVGVCVLSFKCYIEMLTGSALNDILDIFASLRLTSTALE